MKKKSQQSEQFIFSLVHEYLTDSDNEHENQGPMSNRSFYLILLIIALTIGFVFMFSNSFQLP